MVNNVHRQQPERNEIFILPSKLINKKDFNLCQFLSPKMFYGHAMFTGGNSQ